MFQAVPSSVVAESPARKISIFKLYNPGPWYPPWGPNSYRSMMQQKKRIRQASRSPPLGPPLMYTVVCCFRPQWKKMPRQPSRSLLPTLDVLSVRHGIAPVDRETVSAVAVRTYLLASGAADRRTRARVVADEWCSLTHLVMKIPLDIIVIVLGSFDFPNLCETWLDPYHHTDISAEVARWHDQNKDNACPTSFAFRCNPTCPGWILCCHDYVKVCRWKGCCTTPRIIAMQ